MSHAMTGGGDYDRHSGYQMRGARSHEALVEDAADRIVAGQGGSVAIADYGCAEGRVSNALVRLAIERVRRHAPDVPVTVVHNDVLSNDWATLFAHLASPDSYLHVAGGPITPMASATSFYTPVTPRGLVDLGLSFASVQWLSESGPAGTGAALYFDQLDGAARAAIAARAHRDWTRFLELRADELAPGGRMVLDMMGTDESGVATGHATWGLVRAVVDELVGEGMVDRDRRDDYVFPVYERSITEARAPFDEEVARRLRLEHLSVTDVPNPYVEQYAADGDMDRFADGFLGFFRAFSEPSLRDALDPSGTATDELYRRLRARFREAAGELDFTIHAITAVIARVDG
ncbi:hypothetical protein GCM10017608_31510 [Agromyces luteolus]|uniref:SAM-dependent methyltransferase n=1 Tax=Agromyces luteolus TaxID=88373 RepID=A0A7C9HLZ0_9MICO|nr:hypothetical protein [Agromyces luteolus]MUN07864.1 hypothetical protein [Agromyces luteolus]GLK29215.1 hypothetical protein GCM10017608_31510 [Agromyces luteolus]